MTVNLIPDGKTATTWSQQMPSHICTLMQEHMFSPALLCSGQIKKHGMAFSMSAASFAISHNIKGSQNILFYFLVLVRETNTDRR